MIRLQLPRQHSMSQMPKCRNSDYVIKHRTNILAAYTVGLLNAYVGHADPISIYDHITHAGLDACEITKDSFG